MDTYTYMNSQQEPMLIFKVPRDKVWILHSAYTFRFNSPAGYFEIIIPKGFEYDLASIPRFLWSMIAPFELSAVAPLFHDYMYKNVGQVPIMHETDELRFFKGFTRKDADILFNQIMMAEDVVFWKRVLAYKAVRVFGGGVWNKTLKYRRKKKGAA